ncbi:MAG: ATP-binding protein [Tepidisphaeraceae bacterium]|jgi:signal transduction histidine kinase
MLKRFGQVRISLAAKCQILFGAAVVLIIGAALYVPWKRMEQIVLEVNLQTAEGVARQAVMEHRVRPGPTTPLAQAAEASAEPQFVWPRLISVFPPKSIKLDRFEIRSLRDFEDSPDRSHDSVSYRLNREDRYRLAIPLYNEPSCLSCHDGTTASAGIMPAIAVSSDTSRPSPRALLGMVEVDIPSQVTENQLFLNRVFILLAGTIAGTLAIGVLYLIVSRLILQPVRVLQETAEKVSQGDLNIRSDISTRDEFQQLSETFNTMLANLKTRDEQLRDSNKALDLRLGQLAQTNVALYESNRLKSEFLANVSHELRTPLNSILGFAELLKETAGENPESKPARYLQNILLAGRNLLDLINDLLDLAKIEAGRMDVRSEPLSVGDVFEGLINLLRPLAEAKALNIVAAVGAQVPIIQTDPAKLQQVLYNFLSNAIKFSPRGGRVDIVAAMEGTDQVRITVTDQGPGIEAEKHELIFEKFRQIDGSVTRQHSGTGLGLAISKELTVLLGGTIGVASVSGQGAAFWIVLPLRIQPGQRDVREKMEVA